MLATFVRRRTSLEVVVRTALFPWFLGLGLALGPAVLAAACSAPLEPIGLGPGHSDRPRGGPTVPADASAPPVKWERWPEVASYRVAIERAPSQHLAGAHEAETLASPEASAYPSLGPARVLGPGAALVQRLFAPGAAAPDVLFAMVRPGAAAPASPDAGLDAAPPGAPPLPAAGSSAIDWEFLVLDPDGTVQQRGSLDACARCHAEAPHGGLFGRAL
jgi:hypothetical protein